MISIGSRIRLLTDVTLHYRLHGQATDGECPGESCIGEHIPAGTLGTVTYLLDDAEYNDFGVAWDNGDNVEVRYNDVELLCSNPEHPPGCEGP